MQISNKKINARNPSKSELSIGFFSKSIPAPLPHESTPTSIHFYQIPLIANNLSFNIIQKNGISLSNRINPIGILRFPIEVHQNTNYQGKRHFKDKDGRGFGVFVINVLMTIMLFAAVTILVMAVVLLYAILALITFGLFVSSDDTLFRKIFLMSKKALNQIWKDGKTENDNESEIKTDD